MAQSIWNKLEHVRILTTDDQEQVKYTGKWGVRMFP